MSKGMDRKKDTKKKPAKTLMEKRAAKKQKKEIKPFSIARSALVSAYRLRVHTPIPDASHPHLACAQSRCRRCNTSEQVPAIQLSGAAFQLVLPGVVHGGPACFIPSRRVADWAMSLAGRRMS